MDAAQCAQCHERVRFHGSGGRDNNPDHCVMCHNPEMTNSGRGTDPEDATIVDGEVSNNFKDVIHAVHAARVRSTPYRFVRGSITGTTGGQGRHDFSHVVFFDREADCLACHRAGTYLPSAIPASALWTTLVAAPAANVGAFDPSLNLRIAPTYSACASCHDSASAASHMEANVLVSRSGAYSETCVTCHGAGRSADVDGAHGL